MTYSSRPDSIRTLKERHARSVDRWKSLIDLMDQRKLTPAEKDEAASLKRQTEDIYRAIQAKKLAKRDSGSGKRATTEDDRTFTSYLRSGRTEYRADGTGLSTAPNSSGLSAGATGATAGYLIPQGFWGNLQIAMKAYGGLSNDYRYVQTDTGSPMPWPTTDPTAVSGTWLGGEDNQLSVTQPYTFGQGMLNAWTVAVGPFLASLQLVEDSAFDVDQFVADRVGEAIGRAMASMSVSGTGSGQPLGIITALAARGALSGASGGYFQLGTATTVKTFATSAPTELAGNILSPATLLGMLQGIDPAYYPGCRWYMNAVQAWNLRSVVDSNGRPLINFANGFDSDMVTGDDYIHNAPVARLFGFPVIIDNNIPNLTASTVGGPIFGNLQHAMVKRVVRADARIVADTGPAVMMRLTERYADYLGIGYIGYLRADMRSNDIRAAVTVRPAAT
jgi:HK97 family phage major capsid protein